MGMIYHGPVEAAPYGPMPLHVPAPPPPEARERLAAIRAASAAAAAPRRWSEAELTVRMILVMLSCDKGSHPDHAARIARQPWGSFTTTEQATILANARQLHDSLEHVARLA